MPNTEKDDGVRYIITINYKSGISMEMRVVDFVYTVNNAGADQCKWHADPNRKYPCNPLFLNLDEIESIWKRIE